jgi:hypothetical protein
MIDADALFSAARRPIVIGIGGGGDVVGALATAESLRLYHGADPIIGGVTWERRPIDPQPGPRTVAEIEGADEIAPAVLAAGPETHVRESGVLFAESHMAEFLGVSTLLIDPSGGPAALEDGLAETYARLGGDLLVFVDVGGDALAHGDESGLASPLCDALLMAAAARLQASGHPVLGAVFGPGSDGELGVAQVLERIEEVAAAGGLAGARGITPTIAERVEAAAAVVPTEASVQAIRAFRGETGVVEIRGGRRRVELSAATAITVFFDVRAAVASAARLARAVDSAGDLFDANEALHELGVRTELDLEREYASASQS